MPYVQHQARPVAPANNRPKSNTRGNVLKREPGITRHISSTINCDEINRACDAYFVRTIPGYRVMNIGGITKAKRSA